jgi:hypothetical protein
VQIALPRVVLLLGLLAGAGEVAAQPTPSLAEIRGQLDQVVGGRVEAAAILGGQEAPQGGLFRWGFNDVDASVLKYPWSVDLGEARRLGSGGLTYVPVLLGSAGTASFVNHFSEGPLAGSESTYRTYSAGLGAGPRIALVPDLSVLPAVSLLYAYTENDFDAGSDRTPATEAAIEGRLVNWHTHTLTFIPSLELRYRPTFGPLTLGLTSSYAYFRTVPIARSTKAYSFDSESQTWSNRADVELRTPWAIAGWPVLLGGFLNRIETFGGISETVKADHVYATGGHVGLDPGGRLWMVKRVGLAGSYFWTRAFSGWTFGIELDLTF